jgi:hypothetical protein
MEKENVSSDTQDVSKKSAKKISGNKFFEEFNKLCSHEEEYTLDELKKHLSAAYKQASKKVTVKREPSAYNKFMKEEITKLRQENPNKEYKELMKLVAEKWNANKKASQ